MIDASAELFRRVISNILIGDPITSKGLDAYQTLGINTTEETYLKEIYVEPFTIWHREVSKETPDQNNDPDVEITYREEVERNSLLSIKTDFEGRIKALDTSLYVVKGSAGSGKTTYVHHLKIENPNINFCYCDFEKANITMPIFEHTFDFGKKFESNIWKFISIVLEKIDRILYKEEHYEKYASHKEYIKKIKTKYDNYFYDPRGRIPITDKTEIWDFFQVLGEYIEEEETREEFGAKLHNKVSKYLEELAEKGENQEAAIYVCGILIRLFFSLHQISIEEGERKKYIIVIDNIEYFVSDDKEHPIQECELQEIINAILESAKRIKQTIQKLRIKFTNYETCFGFLLVTRDTTATLADCRHYVDYAAENEINITEWYCLEDIYERKLNFYAEILNTLQDNPYYKAYKEILSDVSQYNWGMYKFISQLYNNNFRRIGIDVVNTIAFQPKNVIIFFNEQWEKAKDNNVYSTKHLCRKFILRIILDHIQRKKYFKYLLVENEDAEHRRTHKLEINGRSSYARKISTILYREALEKDRNNSENFITFPELIRAVMKPPYKAANPVESDLNQLASVLYLMNEVSNKETNWSPLVYIKYDSKVVYNEKNLQKIIVEQWKSFLKNGEKITDEMQRFGVRILPAGKIFAKIVSDFEYFACRFASNYGPLFVEENLQKDNDGKYKCIKIIEVVRKNAFLCIDQVITRDYNFFTPDAQSKELDGNMFNLLYNRNSIYKWLYTAQDGGKLIVHPRRIVNHHIGYLTNYMAHISALDENILVEGEKQAILELIQKEIKEYEKKLRKLITQYPTYFGENI